MLMLMHNKKWWLTPIILVLLLFGALIILGSSTYAPFIYTLFRYQVPDSNTGPSLLALLIPLLVFQSALLGLGVGFIISSVSVKYRDLGRLGGLFTQFLMYASPVIYPISEIPEKYQPYLAYNPLTFIVESYRYLLLGHSTGCTWQFGIPSVITTCVLFFIGLILYNKVQRTYVDYV
jgi:lipopolysaccharide transport system permease protein